MYTTNSKIKKVLVDRGYHSFYLFPHSRFMKDYYFEGMPFDALAWRAGESFISFFQFKSNCKPSKKELEAYRQIGMKFNCKCIWCNAVDRKGVEIYDDT